MASHHVVEFKNVTSVRFEQLVARPSTVAATGRWPLQRNHQHESGIPTSVCIRDPQTSDSQNATLPHFFYPCYHCWVSDRYFYAFVDGNGRPTSHTHRGELILQEEPETEVVIDVYVNEHCIGSGKTPISKSVYPSDPSQLTKDERSSFLQPVAPCDEKRRSPVKIPVIGCFPFLRNATNAQNALRHPYGDKEAEETVERSDGRYPAGLDQSQRNACYDSALRGSVRSHVAEGAPNPFRSSRWEVQRPPTNGKPTRDSTPSGTALISSQRFHTCFFQRKKIGRTTIRSVMSISSTRTGRDKHPSAFSNQHGALQDAFGNHMLALATAICSRSHVSCRSRTCFSTSARREEGRTPERTQAITRSYPHQWQHGMSLLSHCRCVRCRDGVVVYRLTSISLDAH